MGVAVLAFVSLAWGQATVSAAEQKPRDLTELTPEQLANIEVTSVAKKPEKRSRTPAAVYVITRDHIRRSGVTTLVDALRLAPGIQVARIDSNKWAVGIRGFASSLTRSVLVLIDGRTVYTPLFAGTYWEVQDTLLEDVERIEVIRGPGGSLWGANAVNGVINIITKNSRDTQGAFVKAGGGTMERGLAGIRYGGTVGEGLTYRAYAKGFDRGPGFHATTSDFDDWRMARAGFRTDWERTSRDTVRVQGDIYRGDAGLRTTINRLTAPFQETVETDTRLSGGNLLANWQHRSSGAEWSLLTYYDRTYRGEPSFSEGRHTGDLDLQRQAVYGRHDLVLGLGYRVSSGTARSASSIVFAPPHRTDHLWTAFFRDELSFAAGRFVLALGSKLEHNGYSGFEVQPNLQALWTLGAGQSFWAAASRAVRTPSRVEHDLTITSVIDPRTPTFIELTGNRQFRPEKIITLQVGHRAQVGRRLSLDTVLFHNTHRDLLSLEAGSPVRESSPPPARVVIPYRLGNGVQGSSYGVEVSSDWNPLAWWQIGGSYSFLRLDLENGSGSLDPSTAASTNGSSPRHMASILSQVKLGSSAVLDVVGRHVGALPARRIPAYTTVDARLGWRPVPAFELAVVGQNLLDRHHPEFPGGGETVEVRRGVYGTVTWTP